jgi:hypothetical protein
MKIFIQQMNIISFFYFYLFLQIKEYVLLNWLHSKLKQYVCQATCWTRYLNLSRTYILPLGKQNVQDRCVNATYKLDVSIWVGHIARELQAEFIFLFNARLCVPSLLQYVNIWLPTIKGLLSNLCVRYYWES